MFRSRTSLAAHVAVLAAAAALTGAGVAHADPAPGGGGPATFSDVPAPQGTAVAAGQEKEPVDITVPEPAAPGTHPLPVRPARVLPAQNAKNKGVGRAGADSLSADYLKYRGGPIQTSPRIYVVYWGDWSVPNGDPYNVQNRLYYFLSGVGGSAWAKTATQYAQGCTVGTFSCGSGATFVTNPTGQFRGWWKDTSFVPATPTDADMKAAAIRAAVHFQDWSVNAQYVIAVPRGHDPAGFVTKPKSDGSSYCAYHWTAQSGSAVVSFTNMPYMPDAGTGRCHNNSVTGDIMDGVSIVAGHEYFESVTDPFLNAWYDSDGVAGESGDKCSADGGYVRNLQFSTGWFPVQSVWSNYNRYWYGAGCVFWT